MQVQPERRMNSYLTRATKVGGDWMSEGGGVVLAIDWPKVIRKWRGGAIKYLDWGPFWGNRWKSSDHWWSLRHAGLVFAEHLITKRIHPSLIRLRSRSNIMTNNQQSPIKLMGVFERKRNKNWTQSVFVILQLHCELSTSPLDYEGPAYLSANPC